MSFQPQMRVYTLACLAALFALSTSACDGCGDSPEDAKDPMDEVEFGSVEFDAGIGDAGVEPRAVLTAESVEPVFSAVGAKGAIPNYVDIQFAQNIIGNEAPRAANDATIVRVSPALAGQLSWKTASTLRFEPAEGFTPSTKYRVTVESVESLDETIRPDQPWGFDFETPAFSFLGLTGGIVDADAGKGTIAVMFSAPVKPEQLAEFAEWSINNTTLSSVKYAQGYSPRVIVADFKTKAAKPDNVLNFSLKPGLPTSGGFQTAGDAKASVTLQSGPSVELFNASRKESAGGFYLEFVCNDESAPGGTRWYWDRESREDYRISRRCLPDEAALKAAIEFNPKVANVRVASGRGGFNILGDFKRGTYNVRLSPGLTTIDGGVLRKAFSKEITIPARRPLLDFVSEGRYLPKSAWDKLAIRHLNTPEVEVTVRHVPERNVAFWLTQSNENLGRQTAVVVAKSTIDLPANVDEVGTSQIDVNNIIGKPEPGIYEVSVKSGTAVDSVRLLMTDMNLVVKSSATKPNEKWPDELFVWVLDMKTTRPVRGADIEVIRPSGDVLATCKSDITGGCKLPVPTNTLDENAPFAVIARKDGEFTYLKYADVRINPGDAEVHGEPYLSDIAYRATTYSDRGVYRPAETAHFVTIIRNSAHRAPKARVPVEIEIRDPRNQVLRNFVERTNEAGVLTFDQKFEDFATTGAYNVVLNVAKRRVDAYRFNVEEFVPERMEVTAKMAAKNMLATSPATLNVTAKYLFGGSAEDSPVEATCRVEPSKFAPKNLKDYRFGRASGDSANTLDLGVAEGKLDAESQVQLECPSLAAGATLNGPSKVIASVAVFEAGSGRSTVNETSARIHPEPYYIGMKTAATKAESGQSFDVEGVVVDWEGKPYTSLKEINIEFIRLDREYWWYYDDDDGEDAWGQNIRPVVESTQTIKVGKGGKFKLTATPGANSNGYVVRASAGNTLTDVKLQGSRRYYYWETNDRSRDMTSRPSRPTTVVIEGPEEIEVAQPTSFKVMIPFKGRVLMTAETHRVITHEWHDVEAGEFEWRLTVGEFTPTVYVSALLVKDPHLDSKDTFMPDRAFGVTPVRVKPTKQLHTLKIEAPDTIEPNSKLDVTVDVGQTDGPTFVTVAAVDEGILSLTKFETPQPRKKLFAKRALGVNTFETVGWAVNLSPAGPSSRTGGGDDEDYEEEGGPNRVMPIKPVALWSGLVKVGADGKAKVSFDVPRYRGALRIMAVSSSTSQTGSADTRVTVRDPLVLQTTLPRFLSAGDEIHVPVFVTNMTGKAGTVNVQVTTKSLPNSGSISDVNDDRPLLEFTGPSTKSIALEQNKSGTVVFSVKGMRQSGVANFRVEAKLGSTTSYDEGIVPFRPSGPRERLVKRVELKAGKTSLTSHVEGWVPTSERTTIWVTNNPYGESFDHLKYLVRYPYGCIEQTTSSTRPLLYVGQFVDLIDPESVSKGGKISDMIAHGIKRIFSMQTASGGFAYWPGSTYPDAWGTAYATHMLLDARDLGHNVPEARLEKALAWMEREVESLSNGRGRSYYKWAEPYIHFVLAKAGRGKKARIMQQITQLPKARRGQDVENAYMLWAALYLAGDRRFEKELRKVDVSEQPQFRESRYSYYSDKRRRGFMLSTFFDLFGADKDGERLAILVGEQLSQKPSHYYTTQEITWSITGLGKWVQGLSSNFDPPEFFANGKKRKPSAAPKGRSDRSWSVYGAGEHETLEVDLKKSDGKVYALISSEGVRTKPTVKYGGEGIKITRTFFNQAGKEIEPDQHELGDLVYSVITIKNTSGAERHNLALVDRFAASFEVENPRLGRGTLPEWVDEDALWVPEHMNIRDDRMEVFGSLRKDQEVRFVYAIRAVSSGNFFAPGPEVEGMYDPEVWGRTQPARVKVKGPWEAYLN